MFRKTFIITVFILLVVFTLRAQLRHEPPGFVGYHKNIYAEYMGSTLSVGVHYDKRFRRGRMDGTGFSLGIGGFNVKEKNGNIKAITFPIEFNRVVEISRGGQGNFIAGIGIIPLYAVVEGSIKHDYIHGDGLSVIAGFLKLGYRYQPRENGLMFQAYWNPLIQDGFQVGWFGLGVGIGFK